MGGTDPNTYYHKPQNKGEVIDLHLSGLKISADEIEVKRAAGVKHVISTQVDVDEIKGICKGTGRIKIRLNEGESLDMVRANFRKVGMMVQEHQHDATKKSTFTTPIF
jgi:hypothetical protein